MFKSKKYIFVFISFLLNVPSNFKGQPLFHSGNMSMGSQNKVTASSTLLNKDRIMNEKDSPNVNVTKTSVIISVTILVIGTFLSSIILKYLGNVPLAHESIILYMYKDITIASLITCFTVSFSMIDCFVNGNGDSMSERNAKMFIYCFVQIVLYATFTSSVVMLIKLYARKQNVLEPEMPWDIDDKSIINIWRGSYFVMSNTFMITTYSFECYPSLYYLFIADPRDVKDLPIGSKLVPSIFLLLCFLNVIMGIISEIYKNHDIRTFSSFSAALATIGDIVFIPLFFVLSFGTVCFLVNQSITGLYEFWILYLVCQLMIGILAPLATIAGSSNLHTFIDNETKELRGRIVSIWNSFKPPRIYPIE